MLTLEEVLADFAAHAGFPARTNVGPNAVGPHGTTPLHWMSTLGDAPAIRLLVAAGATKDKQDDLGNTPLHEAVLNRQAGAAEALLQLGASHEVANTDGLRPQDIAIRDGYAPTKALFKGE